jgi:hypothetical protein
MLNFKETKSSDEYSGESAFGAFLRRFYQAFNTLMQHK